MTVPGQQPGHSVGRCTTSAASPKNNEKSYEVKGCRKRNCCCFRPLSCKLRPSASVRMRSPLAENCHRSALCQQALARILGRADDRLIGPFTLAVLHEAQLQTCRC